MITRAAPALAPAEAARRAAAAPGAFWISTPAADEVSIARDVVGAAPAHVVRGGDVAALEAAWTEARAAWSATGEAPRSGVPVAAGWLSYDLGRAWAGLPPRVDASAQPLAPLELGFHDAVWVRPVGGAATIFARDDAAARRLLATLERPAPAAPSTLGPLASEHDARVYLDGARRVLEYLRAGDAYQVNLARRLSAPFEGEAVELAAALRARAPAPHAAFLSSSDGGAWLVGNSPERFLALDGAGGVETRPIKGTLPTGAARAALLASAKDRAEHVMIVDLERNDLGRVCETGSVVVEGVARVLELPTVLHLVSTVRGRLRADVGLAALLAATFPGGSITGAPKRRAMQIIDELEPFARGPYTGATGWLGAAGDLDLAVAIRTALVSGPANARRLSLCVGGGIVIDSTAESELAETEAKSAAFASLAALR
ncbi:MAG TPA: anthranilate synthase component I family protein [Polyangia bacterium]|nr:anthranilate synthase component I family protein [Polyangia bacterium]